VEPFLRREIMRADPCRSAKGVKLTSAALGIH
jgi:hypothetical protein